jgi:hypothetical protein
MSELGRIICIVRRAQSRTDQVTLAFEHTGSGTICRNDLKDAAHKWCLTPYALPPFSTLTSTSAFFMRYGSARKRLDHQAHGRARG